MSLEQIIARLVGLAETGEKGPEGLSQAEGRALSQRLRAIVDGRPRYVTAATRKPTWIAHLKNPFQNWSVPSAVWIEK